MSVTRKKRCMYCPSRNPCVDCIHRCDTPTSLISAHMPFIQSTVFNATYHNNTLLQTSDDISCMLNSNNPSLHINILHLASTALLQCRYHCPLSETTKTTKAIVPRKIWTDFGECGNIDSGFVSRTRKRYHHIFVCTCSIRLVVRVVVAVIQSNTPVNPHSPIKYSTHNFVRTVSVTGITILELNQTN